jgi:hypothetical protein
LDLRQRVIGTEGGGPGACEAEQAAAWARGLERLQLPSKSEFAGQVEAGKPVTNKGSHIEPW